MTSASPCSSSAPTPRWGCSPGGGAPVASGGLLAVTAALAAWGLYPFGEDSYRYHTEPQYRKVQRLTAFVVPVVQWAVVLAVGFVLAGLWVRSRRKA
jgi:hypothetical protein